MRTAVSFGEIVVELHVSLDCPGIGLPFINHAGLRLESESELKISRRSPKNECEALTQAECFRRKLRSASIEEEEKTSSPTTKYQLINLLENTFPVNLRSTSF